MTNKITKDAIKKLIEQVLKEEQLNEKNYYTTKGAPAFDDDLKTYDGVPKMKKSPIFKGASEKPNGEEFANMAKIVNDTDVSGEEPLTFADLKAASELGDRKHAKKRFNKFINPDIKDIVLGTDDGDTDDGDTDDGTTATPLAGELGTDYNLTNKSSDADFQAASKIILNRITDYTTLEAEKNLYIKFMKEFKKYHTASNAKYQAELSDFNDKVTAFPKPGARGALGVSNTGIGAGDRTYTQMYSDPEFDVANVSQATSDLSGEETDTELTTAAGSFSAAADSSAVAVAELFGGPAGTEGEFVTLGKEMKTVADQIKSIGGTNDKTANLSGPAAFKFAAQANFLFQLFNAGKMAEGKQAGYDFERFCGLLFGGLVAGKGNLAADVISASNNGYLRTSQKFVQDTASISQNAENTYKLVVTKGIPLYYMALIKGGKDGAASYDKIDMYLIKLEKSGTKIQRSYMQANGNFKNFGSKLSGPPAPKEYYALYADTANPIKIDLGLSSLGKDPTKAAKAVADKIAGSTSSDIREIHEASTQIYQLSKNMLRNTDEYRAVKGGSTAAGKAKSPMDYLKQLSDDYVSLKTNYKGLFTVGKDSTTGTAFAEGKKITANFLKKLITESFNK